MRPTELGDALAALTAKPYSVLAGGTDFYPAWVGRVIEEDVLDITALDTLRGIREEDGRFRIGALVTWSDLLAAPLPPFFDGLKLAAREVGGVQIQNMGTICGNICNASPAADAVPNLLTLDALIELRSLEGVRQLPVSDFVQGNRATARRPDELVTAILVPEHGTRARSTFLKLGARRYLVISIAMVAALIETDSAGTITLARLSIGACSARAARLGKLEQDLTGRPLSADLVQVVSDRHLADLSPIDDIRGTAVYRRDAAASLLRRALGRLAEAA
ncbi:MAG: xanthine dehydrogenase family protein subunit M [Kiloniellales bacterium]